MSRIRRGPKRLDGSDDDGASASASASGGTPPASSTSSISGTPVSGTPPTSGTPPVSGTPPTPANQQQAPTPANQQQAPTPANQQQTGWGSWLSSVAQRTQQRLDQLYEIANQPVRLRDAQVQEDGTAGAAAGTLDDLIARARAGGAAPKEDARDSSTQAPTQAPQETPSHKTPTPTAMVSDTISKLSTMAIAARDHWHHQLTTPQGEHHPRTIDAAFCAHHGDQHTDQLLQRGQRAGKRCRQLSRGMRVADLERVAGVLGAVEGLLEGDCILESVVYAERSGVMARITSDPQFKAVSDRLIALLADGPATGGTATTAVNRNRLGEATSLFCQSLSMITDHSDAQHIHLLVAQMIAEVQLFAQQSDLLEDGQYCQDVIVGAAYHLVAVCKLAILSAGCASTSVPDSCDGAPDSCTSAPGLPDGANSPSLPDGANSPSLPDGANSPTGPTNDTVDPGAGELEDLVDTAAQGLDDPQDLVDSTEE